jgi:hypothetical protein
MTGFVVPLAFARKDSLGKIARTSQETIPFLLG